MTKRRGYIYQSPFSTRFPTTRLGRNSISLRIARARSTSWMAALSVLTSLYIPGGSLDENKSRVFKLNWPEQLTHVVDDLNRKYGIAHQDIAARNLVIYSETDDLLIFDFNYSGRTGDLSSSILMDRSGMMSRAWYLH